MAIGVELFDDLDAVARDADGALDRARQPYLYDRIDWLRLTLAHCPPESAPCIVRARVSAGGAAWLFLMDRGHRRGEALTTWYSLAFRPVFACAQEERAPLLRAMAGALRARFAVLSFAPVPDDGSAQLVRAAFAGAGWSVWPSHATMNWVTDTAGADFETWWAARPGRLRNTARRKGRADLDIRLFDSFDLAAWADYEAVYAASWKPEEGSPAFLRALAQQEGAAGYVRLGLAYQGGRPVAAQFWLVENGIATIHKLAYAEDARDLSPGTVLGEAIFRHVMERDRPTRIDFGTGDDAYKADWMDRRLPMWRLDLFDPATGVGLAGIGRAAASALVRRLRSG